MTDYLQIIITVIKYVFFFNNTDSYISRLTASFIFQAFERRKKPNTPFADHLGEKDIHFREV